MWKDPFPDVNDVIENLGWKRLVMSPKADIVSIVREFYVIMSKAANDRAMVKGVFVSVSASTVNPYYILMNVTQE